MARVTTHVRSKLVAGALAVIPVAVTAFIIWYVDKETRKLFKVEHPFFGILLALAAIYLVGLFVTSGPGQKVLGGFDQLIDRVPWVGDAYRSWKDIALAEKGQTGIFSRVVLVPDETGTMRMIGFSTGEPIENDPSTCCVFVPASPNPTSGRLYFVPLSSCTFLDLSPQEAFKLILSGGNHVPGGIGRVTASRAAAARRG